jgi:hypothetical protein
LKPYQRKGYLINEKTTPVIGKVDAIWYFQVETLEAGADFRGDDKGLVFKIMRFISQLENAFIEKSDAENALQCQNTCAISLTLNKNKRRQLLKAI